MSNDSFRRGKRTASKKYDAQRQRGQIKVLLKKQRKIKKWESQRAAHKTTFNLIFNGNPVSGNK